MGRWLCAITGILAAAVATYVSAADPDLFQAVQNRDAEAVRRLLAAKADVNAARADGSTPLAWAVNREHAGIAEALIRAGANVNAADENGDTPLHLACATGNLALVRLLLEAKANPHAKRWTGDTPLMAAAHGGNPEVVKLLIAHGAEVNAVESRMGQTALMWAAAEGRSAATAALLHAGADPHIVAKNGYNALLFAAQAGDLESVQALLAAKADPHYKSPEGNTAFSIALGRGHEAVASLMLARGADVNSRDRNGGTPLHEAVRLGKIALVRELVERGADLGARTAPPPGPGNPFRNFGLSPYLAAAEAGDIAMMRELVKLGADPKATSPDGVGAVMLAAASRKLDAVKTAVELGGDVNEMRAGGGTALHTATRFGALDVIRYLVERGADLNAKDRFGRTPLQAAEFEAPKRATALLRKLTEEVTKAAPPPPAARSGGLPPPPAELSPEEQARLQAKTGELASLLAQLKNRRADQTLLADVEIFHKAGRWLQEFPEEFFTRDDVTNALAVLDQGIERGRQLLRGRSPWMQSKGRRLHGFYSDLDGSVQPYGLRIPDSYDGSKPVRLYVWLHGRDQRLTEANFMSRFPKAARSHSDPADAGQIQLDVYGRWNGMAFHLTGEADVFEAIAAVQKRYNIDPDRIILRGFSMGGCGAWHIALHYPDRWAAAEIGAGTWPRRSQMPGFPPYQQAALRIWENINDWALNAFNLPLAGHGGEDEKGLSSIPPAPPGTPTRGQLESSIKIREQLAREGFPSEGDPYELRAGGTDAVFFISKKTGHSTSPEVRAKLDAFLEKYGDRGRVSPAHIRFLTYTTRYNRSHWVTLDRLERMYERAEVNARRSGGKLYEIATKNLSRLTLRETHDAAEIRIDGQTLKVKPAPEIALDKTAGGWRVGKTGTPPGLYKTHGLQGPIDDAFLDPFLLVRPTGTPWNPAAHGQALRMLARFDRLYAKHLRAHPRIKDDRDVAEEDFRKYHVVLFGDPGSNRWIAKLNGKLPVRWTRDSVALGRESYPAADHFPVLIYPNPLNPAKYVVLNTGLTIEDREYRGEYPMPRLGDFAVLRAKDGADWPDVAAAGLFDERWQLAAK